MQRLNSPNTPSSLRSTAGTWGEIQIAPTAGNVVLDIAARNYDTAGNLHRDTALLNLSIETAIRLRALLEAIEASLDCEPRQAGLWSEATTASIATRSRRHTL